MTMRSVTRRRGTIYVVVLATLSIVLTVSLSSLVNARGELGAATRNEEEILARSVARSGLEIAVELMLADPDWRAGVSGGLLVEKAGMGSAKLRIEVADPIDGDLLDDYADPVEVTAIGQSGRARQAYRYALEYGPEHTMAPERVLAHHPIAYWPLWDLSVDDGVDLRGTADADLKGTLEYDRQDPTGVYDMPSLHVGNLNYYEIDHRAAMEVDYGSISFWMQASGVYSSSGIMQVICSKFRHDQPNAAHFAIICTSGQAYLGVDHAASLQSVLIGPITGDTWHHIAVTWGEDGWKTYLDGEPAAKLSATLGLGRAWTGEANQMPLRFGAAKGLFGRFGSQDMGHYFTGKICEAAMFAYELSEEQVVDLASEAPSPLPLRIDPESVERVVE